MYILFAFNIYDTTFVIFSSLDNFVFIFRIAKLKGITTEKPDPPSDSSDEDEDDEDGAVSFICLELFYCIWLHLAAFGCIWLHSAAFGCIRLHSAHIEFGRIWWHLAAFSCS